MYDLKWISIPDDLIDDRYGEDPREKVKYGVSYSKSRRISFHMQLSNPK